MSIVALKKVSVFGLVDEKRQVLESLQRLGCMHLIAMQTDSDLADVSVTERPEECLQALKYLRASGRRRHQVMKDPDFDVDEVVARVLENRQCVRETIDQRDMLARRIHDREPWGDFEFPDRDDLDGLRLWFYILPLGKKAALEELELPWQIVHQDNLSAYVLVISRTEPPASLLPVARVHTGPYSLRRLRAQLEEAEIQLDTLYAERDGLTRWIYLLDQNIARAEDAASLNYANALTLDHDEFFAVQGWVPEPSVVRLEGYAKDNGLGLIVEEPQPEDAPPTLLENPERIAGGADLVGFYQTPAYRGWDPSSIVLFSFALFFAMILGDAGYGLVLCGIVVAFWKKMGQSDLGARMRNLSALVSGLSVVYGVFAGSYFGLSPGDDTLLGRLQFLELDDFDTMIRLSVVIGAVHVCLANGMRGFHRRSWRERAEPIAWNAVVVGGLLLWLSDLGDQTIKTIASAAGIGLLAVGALIVLVFGSEREVRTLKDALLRFLGGLLSLTNATKVFGDVLSYLRLFALGLASASLAITFNQLANDVAAAAPGAGLLLKLLILLLGHGLNLTLAVISGVVHGLRLNFIEFFNWGVDEEGYPYRPFYKKEAEL